MDESKDPPIEPQEYLHGVNVVHIEDLRISRGLTRRPRSSCNHINIVYDQKERRIWCSDCESDVDPFDAFTLLAERSHAHANRLNQRKDRLDEAEKFAARSLAVKELDKVWRSRNMVPACPTCGHGLLPEMFKNGVSCVLGSDYAKAKLKAREKP